MFKLILFNIYSSSLLIFIIIGGVLLPSNWTYQADLLNATNVNDFVIDSILHVLSLYEKKIMHRKTGMIITFVTLRFNGLILLILIFYKIFF